MTRKLPRVILPALLLLGAAACDDAGDATSDPATSPTVQHESTDSDEVGSVVIEVGDNSFAPDETEVAVGEIVTWDFSTADRPHDVVFDDQHGSAILEEGTWSTSFDQPGTYAYECTLHSGMTGQITVTG